MPKSRCAKDMKIGVFDSGIGGKSIANAIKSDIAETDIVYVNDREHVPYGDKSPEQLLGFVTPILQKLERDGCQVIVIACNTVTTTIISELREIIKIPLVGIEPMVKPAAKLTQTGVIAVCATPATLASQRYTELKETYAKDIKVLQPDCSDWAYMIENNTINEQKLERQISEVCEANADVIVLGCTHYHWIEEKIKSYAKGRAQVIQPEQAVVTRLKIVLKQLA